MLKSNIGIQESQSGFVKNGLRRDKGLEVVTNGFNGLAGKRFHFIGVGGIGMSGLAMLVLKHKAIVTGSDQNPSETIDQLCQFGADIKVGHKEHNLNPEADAVVISAAIKEENPELKLARREGIRVYKYAEMLGKVFGFYQGIAISGTHGKSTTSGWLAYLFKQANLSPNFVVGAVVTQLAGSSGIGTGLHFVAEACEYDRSFLNLKPQIAVILNIEADHLDYYKDEAEIVEAFRDFALGTKNSGVIIANGEDKNVAKIIMDSRFRGNDKGELLENNRKIETFGFGKENNFYADKTIEKDGLYSFDVYHNKELLGSTHISVPGRHNVANALAVIAVAQNAGIPTKDILRLLPGFTGVDRRLMLKAKVNGITILDDYAHHPTEIRASLRAIKEHYQPKRLWCIFQPHQYSRTRFLLDDFAESFKLADITIMPEIYFVRDSQQSKKEVNAQVLVDKIRAKGSEAMFIDGFDAICDYLTKQVRPGDVVVTMGAGDVWKVSDGYIQWLRKNS
jgi:UDP-N-acetylmuramate--alanine ligase